MTARHGLTAALTAALASLLVIGPASTAYGSESTTSATTGPARAQLAAERKARGDAEIQRRLTTLDQLTVRVTNSRHLTDADRSRLKNEISNEKSGLTSLKSKIDADSDLATLREDLRRIVTDYRVYVLVVPQVRLTGAADAVLALADRFTTLDSRLTARLDEAAAAGNDVGLLRGTLSDAEAKVAAAKALAGPLPDTLAALMPAGYPSNRSELVNARESLRTARTDLRAARDDVRQVIAAVRAFPAVTTTT